LIKQKKYKEAEARYTEALKADPYNKKLNSIILSNRALCYMKEGEKNKALQDLNDSLALDPNYVKSLVRRAEINMEKEEYEAAIHDYAKIQELDPNVNLKAKIDEAKKKEKLAKKKDYYAILGVSKTATDDEIKKAYKKLALKYHPDRNRTKTEVEQQEAAKKFKDIAEANGILGDPEKRKKYDSGGMDFEDGNFEGFGGMPNGGMGGGGSTRVFFNGQDMSGAGIDPSQLFGMFFSQGGNDPFGGFGSKFGGAKGGKENTGNKRGASQGKQFKGGFGGFPGFGGFGGFDQAGAHFN
jgi:DnaJ homolog subfamily C member 7